MITLCIEQSTSVCSAALLRDSATITEKEWEDTRLRNQQIFPILDEMFRSTSLTPAEIDMFATGLGPGSFSGLRCALATLHGLAMPGRKPIFGITSTEALAWQVMKETGLDSVMILGDARRSTIWCVGYEKDGGIPKIRTPLSLVQASELVSVVKNTRVAATSHWDRIGIMLKEAAPQGVAVLEGNRTPRASTIAELMLKRISLGIPSDPLVPIYLHPAVAIRSQKKESGSR